MDWYILNQTKAKKHIIYKINKIDWLIKIDLI